MSAVLVVALAACEPAPPPASMTSETDSAAREVEPVPSTAPAPSSSTSTSTTIPTTTVPATTVPTTSAPTTTTAPPEQAGGDVDVAPPTSPVPTAPVPTAAVIGAWRGTYVPHGWVGAEKSATAVADAVAQLADAGFTHQLHNIGFFDTTGTIPADDYRGLAAWVQHSRAADPDQQIIAWVSGDESTHVDQPATHDAIAAWVEQAVSQHGLDGVLLDFEPFSPDNPRLVDLVATIRQRVPSVWLGIASPTPATRWSPAFISAMAQHVDALSPMLYDSGIDDQDEYVAWAHEALERYRAAAGGVDVLPSIPAHGPNPWHDPAVENIETAGSAISRAGGVTGAAVYWWWEFDAEDLTHWTMLDSGGNR